jgi:putative aldouronate transport system permease protein
MNSITPKKTNSFFTRIKPNIGLYIMLMPGLIFLFIYKFVPLFGLLIAFKDFNIFLGENPFESIMLSPYVGWDHFIRLFGNPDFAQVLKNTLIINGYKIIFLFPLPLIAAIMLNEIRQKTYTKLIQTFIYIPYFFSWVVVFGIFYSLLGNQGIVNELLTLMGLPSISFFTEKSVFRSLLVVTEGWKETGWYAVIYLASITSIDPSLYEAAKIDGAGKLKQIKHITLPSLFPTIVLLLIMKVGYILDTGFEQILVMYNPTVYDVADVIQTNVYRKGMGQMDFSLGTALGLFNSVISFILIVGSNTISKKFIKRSIW